MIHFLPETRRYHFQEIVDFLSGLERGVCVHNIIQDFILYFVIKLQVLHGGVDDVLLLLESHYLPVQTGDYDCHVPKHYRSYDGSA